MGLFGKETWRGKSACLFYNLGNALLLAVFLKEAFVIRSDGGAGFGEFVLKSLLALLALVFFAAGVGASWNAFVKRGSTASWVVCALSACLLMALAALGVWEACSDGAGHCREWQFFPS